MSSEPLRGGSVTPRMEYIWMRVLGNSEINWKTILEQFTDFLFGECLKFLHAAEDYWVGRKFSNPLCLRSNGSTRHSVPGPGQYFQLRHCQLTESWRQPLLSSQTKSPVVQYLLCYPSLLTEMMMAALKGLTAVETWVVSCIIHVFGVLAEYALILKMIQSMKRREAEEKKKEQREMRKQIELERR